VIDRDSRYAECEVLADGSVGLWLAPSASSPPNDQLHVVIAGDRLDALAHLYYGDATRWWVISVSNRLFFPLDVKPGSVLQIPTRFI